MQMKPIINTNSSYTVLLLFYEVLQHNACSWAIKNELAVITEETLIHNLYFPVDQMKKNITAAMQEQVWNLSRDYVQSNCQGKQMQMGLSAEAVECAAK